jgi:hypothetical protein
VSARTILLFGLGALLMGPAAARAQNAPPAARASGERAGFSFAFGLERLHDDNILQMTGANLARFDRNPDPPRFAITSVDDDVNGIHAALRWRARPWPRRETRVTGTFDFDDFVRNDVKDWGQFGLTALQQLTASRHNLLTARLAWSRIPRYYLGEITDADDSFAAGTRIRRGLDYAQSVLGVRLTQGLDRGRYEFALSGERASRDYGSHFDERDNHNDSWQVDAGARPIRRSGVTLQATYIGGKLSARGDLASSPIVDADISYEHSGLGGSLGVPWGRGGSGGRVDVSVMPEVRTYTTADKFDLTRYGRVNRRLDTLVRVTQSLAGPLDLRIEYERLTSRGSYTTGLVAPEEATDFTQNRLGISLRARLDLPGR